MDFSERDVLIDYLLGRLSHADAKALEQRAAEDAELAQTLEELRSELNLVDKRSSFFGRWFGARSSHAAPYGTDADPSEFLYSDKQPESKPSKPEVRPTKRYAFIPKRVEAPSAAPFQKGLVFKHAAVLSPEELARRKELAKLERRTAPAGASRIFSRERYSYALRFHISDFDVLATAIPRALLPGFALSVPSDRSMERAPAISSGQCEALADFISVQKRAVVNMGRVHAVDSQLGDVSPWTIVKRASDASDVCLAQSANLHARNQVTIDSVFLAQADGLYRVFPLEFFAGRSAYLNDDAVASLAPSIEPQAAPTNEVQNEPQAVAETASPSAAPDVSLPETPSVTPTAPLYDASSEVPQVASVVETPLVPQVAPVAETPLVPLPVVSAELPAIETPLAAPQTASPLEAPQVAPLVATPTDLRPETVPLAGKAAKTAAAQYEETRERVAEAPEQKEKGKVALQETNASFSVEPEEEDREVGPTLSAEDAYLVELLGREPTAIELDEYYWEDYGESKPSRKIVLPNFVEDAITLITAPPVLVGHITIKIARIFLPRGFSRGEDFKQSSVQGRGKANQSRFSDMMISMVAGILIAVCFVFPALRFVVNEVYRSVAESAVRKIGENVTLTQQQQATEEALLPVMTEHILYPHYNDPNSSEPQPSDETTYRFDALPE